MSCYSTFPGSFSDVLVIFALITILGNAHRPCEQYPNIVSNHLQHTSSFLLIIPDFQIIFTVPRILGNAHRPCKEYTHIIDNGLHHISLFFRIFFWFSGYIMSPYEFTSKTHSLSTEDLGKIFIDSLIHHLSTPREHFTLNRNTPVKWWKITRKLGKISGK